MRTRPIVFRLQAFTKITVLVKELNEDNKDEITWRCKFELHMVWYDMKA